ncbi:acyl-CoA reductase-like NAD-dependent aldehyde dehydrogenase [Thermosporothrix hazakensis]|uniref:Acyl-CoA reductase-like NAD-dependent aldehyde dehydrogenase n=2 Tax=Thermosporothrix TaxID=768650 RepID=A0A326U5K0_THEHA|nr:aldehyde dehydrogenase family protein [Thermosporothrix hazakensis]PZW21068.1 acyl-CoA reductase-like NAD-dependent aldehyde dehydrogenase [Thermosporothrix hazakensis]BBH88200.1 hypothetical protein KTC_29510 [Thermosporothrix sp. COM3]GCE46388.1 hypothetical protein KTH_12570 [Thermosporothrix hazakensis]
MAASTQHGSPRFPTITGVLPPSTQEEMDTAVKELQRQKDVWVALSIRDRITLLETLLTDMAAIAERWVHLSCQAKALAPDLQGEEWAIGPWPVLRNLRQLQQSLRDIELFGRPHIPGPVQTLPNGQTSAQVFPYSTYDRLFFPGVTAEIWMEPGVSAEALPETQALIYQQKQHPGKVALVLGAGNVSSIAPTDVLYKLFAEDQVVVLKMNPVNAYIGPLIEKGFRVLIERGFLRVTYGGAAEGAYLCNHPGVDEIHITGSDKTFEAIVFGTGEEGARRKAENQPLLHKPITGELGNVSPVIVVPGPWTTADIAYQAEHLVTSLTTNAGFNCNATRVIIQHAGWNQRQELLQALRATFAKVPPRTAFYPGARDRFQSFLQAHPDAETLGSASEQQLPWTLIPDVYPTKVNDICFTTEAFCALSSETALPASSVVEYLDRAVEFANETLWGTLNATILIHPLSLRDPEVAAALDRAIERLRYGTVSVNYWAATSFTLGVTTWGAFPGHTLNDVQSGIGVVHNTLLFSRPQKTVLRAPFRSVPTPPWFATRTKAASALFPRLADFERDPSPLKIPGLALAMLK